MTDNDRVSTVLSLDVAPTPTIETVLPLMDSIVEQAMIATDLSLEVAANQEDAERTALLASEAARDDSLTAYQRVVQENNDLRDELAATFEQLRLAQATVSNFVAREVELQGQVDVAQQEYREQLLETLRVQEVLQSTQATLAKYQRGLLSSKDVRALFAPRLEQQEWELMDYARHVAQLEERLAAQGKEIERYVELEAGAAL